MDLLEISTQREMSREEAAKVLHDIADALERHNKLDFLHEGKKIRVDVADQVSVEVELEVETDKSSLEIEIKW
jgi:amphi-Trp domain-containing protein